MCLVKITSVLIIVYFFFYKARVKAYVNSLTGIDGLRFTIKNYTPSETRMMLILGTLRILCTYLYPLHFYILYLLIFGR